MAFLLLPHMPTSCFHRDSLRNAMAAFTAGTRLSTCCPSPPDEDSPPTPPPFVLNPKVRSLAESVRLILPALPDRMRICGMLSDDNLVVKIPPRVGGSFRSVRADTGKEVTLPSGSSPPLPSSCGPAGVGRERPSAFALVPPIALAACMR